MYLTILRDPDEDGVQKEITVEVDYYIEPREYEDGYLFYPGGVFIENVYLDGKEITLSPSEENHIQDMLREKVEVPTHHYRGDY